MVEQIKMGDEQMSDVNKPSAQIICNLYLQDLYRFYTLSNIKSFFTNPFNMDMMVHEAPFFRLLNPEGTYTHQLADFFFAKELYTQALSAYQKSEEHGKHSPLTFRKMGYCYQKLGEYNQAIELYQKAELISEQDTWTLRKLAYCYRMKGCYEQALSYYLQVDAQKPNDLNVIFNIGNCYTQLGKYTDALNAFYKIEFLQGDMSKSIYYHLYMAHCLWATGETQKAMEHYALFPHEDLAEQLEKPEVPLSAREKVYVVDYLRYLTNIRN
jgi:tetratricopeptide (TPR) repeat protein